MQGYGSENFTSVLLTSSLLFPVLATCFFDEVPLHISEVFNAFCLFLFLCKWYISFLEIGKKVAYFWLC